MIFGSFLFCVFIVLSSLSSYLNISSVPALISDVSAEPISYSKNTVVVFDWTKDTIFKVGIFNKNYNRIKGTDWGIINRSDDMLNEKVLPYRLTDPGMRGPSGESYGIEIEFGDLSIPPRSKGSKSLRHYIDCGQTGFQERGHDRSEVHIRSILSNMGIQENTILWVGWSEYYKNLDEDRISTILQFRNQPSSKLLGLQGISSYEGDIFKKVVDGGPAFAIELHPALKGLNFHFAVRKGTPNKWKIPAKNKHTINDKIMIGVWYDFVLQIKYSQGNDGFIRVWHSLARDGASSMKLDAPEWSYSGATMYQYPIVNEIQVRPIPSLRWGVYRYGCKSKYLGAAYPEINKSNRYMTKYLGPVRFWKGQADEGFKLVRPRD